MKALAETQLSLRWHRRTTRRERLAVNQVAVDRWLITASNTTALVHWFLGWAPETLRISLVEGDNELLLGTVFNVQFAFPLEPPTTREGFHFIRMVAQVTWLSKVVWLKFCFQKTQRVWNNERSEKLWSYHCYFNALLVHWCKSETLQTLNTR